MQLRFKVTPCFNVLSTSPAPLLSPRWPIFFLPFFFLTRRETKWRTNVLIGGSTERNYTRASICALCFIISNLRVFIYFCTQISNRDTYVCMYVCFTYAYMYIRTSLCIHRMYDRYIVGMRHVYRENGLSRCAIKQGDF